MCVYVCVCVCVHSMNCVLPFTTKSHETVTAPAKDFENRIL